jgi:hypothetical protein
VDLKAQALMVPVMPVRVLRVRVRPVLGRDARGGALTR